MKKHFNHIILIILILILLYTIFILEESIRLSNATNAKPLIIVSETNNTYKTTYSSIGFKLVNKYGKNTEEKLFCLGQEFWLFDKFMIWGWIS